VAEVVTVQVVTQQGEVQVRQVVEARVAQVQMLLVMGLQVITTTRQVAHPRFKVQLLLVLL